MEAPIYNKREQSWPPLSRSSGFPNVRVGGTSVSLKYQLACGATGFELSVSPGDVSKCEFCDWKATDLTLTEPAQKLTHGSGK
jgi:hypothetical protein